MKKFSLFELKYLGRSGRNRKNFFFRNSGSTNCPRLFFGALADSAILMRYLNFRGHRCQNGYFEKPTNLIFSHMCRNFCPSAKIFLPKKTCTNFWFWCKMLCPNFNYQKRYPKWLFEIFFSPTVRTQWQKMSFQKYIIVSFYYHYTVFGNLLKFIFWMFVGKTYSLEPNYRGWGVY